MSTALVAQGSGFGRVAKASDEYVKEIVARKQKMAGRTLTAAEKKQKLASILADRQNGILRLGQSMIGPIQLQLRYQGILRNVLIEDALTPGVPIQYDVLDDLGQAYILHGNEGEVRITPFEGKRVEVRLFRIATFPKIKKEDLYYLRSNLVEYAQDQSKQAIMKQEDARLITLIEAAAAQYRTVDASAAPGGALPNEITITTPTLTPDDLYTAVTYTSTRQLDSARLLVNPAEYYDFYRWDINTTGWAFKDSVVAGEKIVQFGQFQIGQSIMIPKGTIYLTPEPQFLGVFPVMYSLDVEENPQVEQFHKGWVMDELVGMAILNARGLIILRKS
ncbi:major capsid protein [Gordonia phage RedWattleHog]|uniref:Major capsid protein n=1 Tax=Gordonia phage Stormageddon TaxID=2656541 RepID=A0A649VRD9_9CAUD|nr:major head protein [Gordonia phage Stormageddon]QGJ94878.1 major capsid protein [Gordonia phage Stormageddon]QLF83519.1 major capsid protein [Gordonia phage RedWattleHog]